MAYQSNGDYQSPEMSVRVVSSGGGGNMAVSNSMMGNNNNGGGMMNNNGGMMNNNGGMMNNNYNNNGGMMNNNNNYGGGNSNYNNRQNYNGGNNYNNADNYKQPLISNMHAPIQESRPISTGIMSMFEAVIPFFAGGRLYATTDKPYYVPGELVTGSIVADLSAPVNARGIDLVVAGFEKVEWHDVTMATRQQAFASDGAPQSPPQQYQKVHRHRGRKDFFKQKLRIYEIAGGTMMPGQHRFPFQYQLPEGLPGSFLERRPMPHLQHDCEFEDDDMYHANWYDSDDEDDCDGPRRGPDGYRRTGLLAMVTYKLKVTLDVGGFFHPNLHARIPLIIHPKLSASLTPAISELTSDVTLCCCINKGSATVKAFFDKTAYTRGETAQITADVDNRSTQTLSMVVKLNRILELNSGQRRFRGQKIDRQVVAQQKYEAVLPHSKIVRPMPLALNTEDIKPSTEGEFVKCSYQYTVECQISMGSDIILRMPVIIYAPQPRPLVLAQ